MKQIIQSWLFKIFIGTGIRLRRVRHKDFKCYVKEEKYRIIHPFVFIVYIFIFIYYLYNGGIKGYIEDVKRNICIF